MLVKKSSTVFAMIGIVLSSTVSYANNPTNNTLQLTIPDLQPGFEFSIAALALKPGASNLNYVIYNKELPVQSPSWTEEELKPGFGAAFELGGRYHFSGGEDVSLDWTHFNSTASDSTVAPDASYFVGPDYQIGPDGLPIRSATGRVKFEYDVVNLTAGQVINIGSRVITRFFAGLSNAYLRENVASSYSGRILTGVFTGPFTTMQNITANFTGIGPRLGLDISYNTDCGFGIFAEGAAAALVGYTYSKTNFNSSAPELFALYGQTSNPQFIRDQNVNQVIPGFDTQLGVSYHRAFNNKSLVTLELGYQAAVYLNAISQYLPQTLAQSLTTGGIFVDTMSHRLSNYSVQGPFLKLSYRI